ncbi:MAG: aminotransferase class III-fold pyridoxal phosphate-dependent enzyme [Chloroflexi bacterium]|nr:aminotransferase class III-fold pyridoxal phosphate-dependent enzyme [Chloroflexota bacterium]
MTSRWNALDQEFRQRFHLSADLHRRASQVLGTASQPRTGPGLFPVAAARTAGSHKWTIDGHELIDYCMSHNSLVLGHSPPVVAQAVAAQIGRGVALDYYQELEVRWAELVLQACPWAGLAKMTGSLAEAVMVALRLARAYTGRRRIVKFLGHAHGWPEELSSQSPADLGLGEASTMSTIPTDVAALEHELRSNDVAAVIMEPVGALWGACPLPSGFLDDLRRLTQRYGTLLVLDEAVTGFRLAPGGASEFFSVTPELAVHAGSACGGVACGAVVGMADIMEALARSPALAQAPVGYRAQLSAWNPNPVALAGAIAALEVLNTGVPQRQATRQAEGLRQDLNQVLVDLDLRGCAYGVGCIVHVYLSPDFPGASGNAAAITQVPQERLLQGGAELAEPLRKAMLLQGCDFRWSGNLVSAAHIDEDIRRTIAAFHTAVERLRREGIQ